MIGYDTILGDQKQIYSFVHYPFDIGLEIMMHRSAISFRWNHVSLSILIVRIFCTRISTSTAQ